MKTKIEADLLPTVVEVLAVPGDFIIVMNGVVIGVQSADETKPVAPSPTSVDKKRVRFDERAVAGYLKDKRGHTAHRLASLLALEDVKERGRLQS